jgi:hypothetical protein
MEQLFVFVYAKEGKIKCLSLEEAKKQSKGLIEDGWVHTQTLDPCLFIQYLHNDCDGDDLAIEIISLRKED